MTTSEVVDTNFGSLLYGLNAAAVLYLGLDGKTAPNLELARQNINILITLKDKTRGNLALAEESLINEIIADLQAKYAQVSATNKPTGTEGVGPENKLEDNGSEA